MSTTTTSITIGTAFGKRMPVRVIDRQERLDGVRMARIVSDSGLDAWVKPTSLKREVIDLKTTEYSVPDPVTEPGMYKMGEHIFKVQESKTSGNLYAKRLVRIGGDRLNEALDVVHFEFQYDPGAIRTLRAEQRMTLDEAKAFGIMYGVCCVCGLTLKDATSVAAGIGPVCGKRI